MAPHPNKITKIQQFPQPRNRTDIRAFVNLAGSFRRHVQNFSYLSAPLVALLANSKTFYRVPDQENAFQAMKAKLQEATLLKLPEPHKPYSLYTDASNIGIGAVLTQTDDQMDNAERPICFLSRKLQPDETGYSIVEKELLAIVYAMHKSRKYLVDTRFTLYTYNNAVKWLIQQSDPRSRLRRWIIILQEFDLDVIHIPTKANVVADGLSRYLDTHSTISDLEELSPEQFIPAFLNYGVNGTYEPYLTNVIQALQDVNVTGQPNIRFKARKFALVQGKLYRDVNNRRVYVPPQEERYVFYKEFIVYMVIFELMPLGTDFIKDTGGLMLIMISRISCERVILVN